MPLWLFGKHFVSNNHSATLFHALGTNLETYLHEHYTCKCREEQYSNLRSYCFLKMSALQRLSLAMEFLISVPRSRRIPDTERGISTIERGKPTKCSKSGNTGHCASICPSSLVSYLYIFRDAISTFCCVAWVCFRADFSFLNKFYI